MQKKIFKVNKQVLKNFRNIDNVYCFKIDYTDFCINDDENINVSDEVLYDTDEKEEYNIINDTKKILINDDNTLITTDKDKVDCYLFYERSNNAKHLAYHNDKNKSSIAFIHDMQDKLLISFFIKSGDISTKFNLKTEAFKVIFQYD